MSEEQTATIAEEQVVEFTEATSFSDRNIWKVEYWKQKLETLCPSVFNSGWYTTSQLVPLELLIEVCEKIRQEGIEHGVRAEHERIRCTLTKQRTPEDWARFWVDSFRQNDPQRPFGLHVFIPRQDMLAVFADRVRAEAFAEGVEHASKSSMQPRQEQ